MPRRIIDYGPAIDKLRKERDSAPADIRERWRPYYDAEIARLERLRARIASTFGS